MTDLIDTFPIDLDHVFLVPSRSGVERPPSPSVLPHRGVDVAINRSQSPVASTPDLQSPTARGAVRPRDPRASSATSKPPSSLGGSSAATSREAVSS